MRLWGLAVAVLLALVVAGCGGGTTTIGVTISGPHVSPMTILVGQSAQLGASVTGGSATTVFWQICLAPATAGTQPTNCTAGQGPATGCTIPSVSSPLTGYGTITANGLYTAPLVVPTPNNAVIVATSCVRSTDYGTFTVIIDSGIRVTVTPATATMAINETLQFTATVTGTTNTGVSWTLSGSGTPPPPLGSITATGLYMAPSAAVSLTVTAQSAADPTQNGTATVSVTSGTPPALTSIEPTVAAQGSVQQDVYLTGSNFLNTETVYVTPPAPPVQPPVPVPTTFLSTTLLRATIPTGLLTQAGAVSVVVKMQGGSLNTPGPLNLNVFPVRPALVSSSPDSVGRSSTASPSVLLTGGFYSPANTTATFNAQSVAATFVSTRPSRQLNATLPPGAVGTPGLYPLVVQNQIAPSQLSIAAANLAVTPEASLIPGAPSPTTVSVGASPSAIAMDEADGIAVVANTSDNTISLLNISTLATTTINVGKQPTGVAVDDLLPDPVALVVNSKDQTVTALDLVSLKQTTLNVSISSGATPPLPFSIGVNPLTHRTIVAYQSTDEATILNVSVTGGVPALSIVQQIGGTSTSYSTGAQPAVAIDPRLNWAVVTPGGGGTINVVDLGVAPGLLEPLGRSPQIVASVTISTSIQGVGINSETHEVFFADPQPQAPSGSLTTFSLLNNTVTNVLLSPAGQPVSTKGYVAAAVTPLENVGIAVNGTSQTAAIVDLENNVVLQNVSGSWSKPVAVAVDPATNQALVVDQTGGQVYFVALGPAINPLQIVEASPAITASTPGVPSADLTLTINGTGFVNGTSQVLLDGTPVVSTANASGRQIVATVPGAMLNAARRYTVQVQNAVGVVSNVTDLTVVQAVAVGNSPVGVAVDTDRDAAVVTNSADGTVSLVSLAPPDPVQSPESLGPVGTIGKPILVGTTPEGVAVSPRLGLAVVANFGSNNVSVVDVTGVNTPVTVGLLGTGPTGAAINQDTATAVITNTNGNTPSTSGTISLITLSGTPAVTSSPIVDQNPIAAAVDPTLNYAAVATASSSSSVDFINLANGALAGRASGTGIQDPAGVVFDPVNQMFVAANSLLNNVVIIDPTTFLATPVRVGIAPMSVDYNFQASTLVTVNPPSHTMSVLDYVCPPAAACSPSVRTVIGLGGTQVATPVLGPNTLAIDPKLNLAVLVDQDNNRVLLVPLPH